MGAGGGVGIGGPDDSWNDGELQEETTHAKRSDSDVSAAVEVREWRRIGRGIGPPPRNGWTSIDGPAAERNIPATGAGVSSVEGCGPNSPHFNQMSWYARATFSPRMPRRPDEVIGAIIPFRSS